MRTMLDNVEVLILIYGTLVFLTVFFLSLLMVTQLEYYMTAFALEFFVAVLITSPYHQSETKRQIVIGTILIVIFIAIVLRHVLLLLQ